MIEGSVIDWDNIEVVTMCSNCDNRMKNNEIRYSVISKDTGVIKSYCCNICLKMDLLPDTQT